MATPLAVLVPASALLAFAAWLPRREDLSWPAFVVAASSMLWSAGFALAAVAAPGAPLGAALAASAVCGIAAALVGGALLTLPGAPVRAAGRARTVVDGLIVASSTLFVVLALGARTGFPGDGLRAVAAVAPAVGATAASAMAVVLLSRVSAPARPHFALLAGALLLLAAGHWTAIDDGLDGAAPDALAGFAWAAGWLVLVRAAARPALRARLPAAPPGLPGHASVFVPSVPVAVALCAGAIRLAGDGVGPGMVWTALALALLVVVRQVLALVENIGFWRDLERSLRARSEALQESRRVEERLTHRALHDPLTGLGNRDLLFEQLERALPVAAGEGAFPAVLFIDLDDFKSVNDRLGHLAGDALLVEIARRLEAAARAGDTVARLGGDEFAILAEGVPGEGAVRQLAERVLAALRRPVDLGGVELAPRMSLGIAVAQRSDRPSELVRRADVAMYAAKAGGAGDYCLFDRELAVEDRLPSAF